MTNLSIKYMPLMSFIAFLEANQLSMKRIDLFEDPYEGSPGTSSDDGIYYVRYGRMIWVSCWCNYEHGESIAMWDLYAGASGVAIITETKKLKSFKSFIIPDSGYSIVDHGFSDITYKDTAESGDFLTKRQCFRHEEEQRLWVRLGQKDYEPEAARPDPVDIISADIKLEEIQEILISPRAPAWVFESLKSLINSKNKQVIVRHSKLLS